MSNKYLESEAAILKDTKFIEVKDVINWIANKISPLSDEPESLTHFKKSIQKESGNELLPLTLDDRALLAIIFESMPMGDTFPYGLSYDEFNQYREVFESSSKKPDWELHAEFQNKKLISQQRRQLTAKTHISLLEQANKDRKITILSDRLAPIDRAAYASLISVKDAKNYLSTYGIRLVKTDKGEELMKAGLYRLHDYDSFEANQAEMQVIAEPSPSYSKPASDSQASTAEPSANEELAGLFDGVSYTQLAKMFPTNTDAEKSLADWKSYADKAGDNKLKEWAKVGRAKFNPFMAASWWLDRKKPIGWDWARCLRVLSSNLPPRSIDQKGALLGDDYK